VREKQEEVLPDLPVETVEHVLPEAERICPECSSELHVMGHDTRRELKIIPAQVKIVEHVRDVYACRNCEKTATSVPIIKASMAEPVIKGSLASPSAVAHIMSQKYVMHSPLYRQEQDWDRQGVYLSRQTMANWIIKCSEDWLQTIYDRMYILLLTHEILHADETVVQVLIEPGKKATSDSYMWLYRTSGDTEKHIILYEYQPSRKGDHPKTFLEGAKGLLHVDGYAGYNALPDGITRVGCWVHLRRKLTDALKSVPKEQKSESTTQKAIKKIGYLFHLEDKWEELEPDKRQELRLDKSKPLAEEFFDWMDGLRALPESPIGKAVTYAQNQKK
jgi:transposase